MVQAFIVDHMAKKSRILLLLMGYRRLCEIEDMVGVCVVTCDCSIRDQRLLV